MPKFTQDEKAIVKGIVAAMSIKRLESPEIIKEIYAQTNKMVTKQTISNIRKKIKKDSYKWYSKMRESEFEYIHEFKERIDEILWLQRKHYNIIEQAPDYGTQQTSLAELHRLNITLSNYFDVAPEIINDSTISTPSEKKAATATTSN